jgi:signal transduction histidine kinase
LYNDIQIFLNLLQNAMAAMPHGGDISLTSQRLTIKGQEFGRWRVSDTGHGIKPEHLSRIFDPFFTTKDTGEGTGLGLSICYGLCKEISATLEVESEIDEGTTFTVTIPLCHA